MKKKINIIVFDMDGTLVESRLDNVSEEVKDYLRKLKDLGYKLIILSSGNVNRLYSQIRDVDLTLLGNFGSERAEIKNGQLVLHKKPKKNLTLPDEEIAKRIEKFRQLTGFTEYKGDSFVKKLDHIIISLIGSDAPRAERVKFDPNCKIRKKHIKTLQNLFPDYVIDFGGLTSYNILPKDCNKYINLTHYLVDNHLDRNRLIFFGDQTVSKYGNDYVLKANGINCVQVNNYNNICKLVDKYVLNVDKKRNNR